MTDFWPEGEWHNEKGIPVSMVGVAPVGASANRNRMDSVSSSGSMSELEAGMTVVDQMKTFQSLGGDMQNVITEVGMIEDELTGDR